MRLIDADVMIEYLRKQLCDNCHEQKDWCDICDYAYLIDEMKKVPTVDVNGIGECLCKDCVYFYDVGKDGWGRCHENGGRWQRDDYCSWGKMDEVTDG